MVDGNRQVDCSQGGNPSFTTTSGTITLPVGYTKFYGMITFDRATANTDTVIVKGFDTDLTSFSWYSFFSTTGAGAAPYSFSWLTLGK